MKSVPERPTAPEALQRWREGRADEILDEIPEEDWGALVGALAGLLISAARSERRWRSISGPQPEAES